MTNGKAHAHAGLLGGKQRLEDLSEVGGINTSPRILDRHLNTIGATQFGRYLQHTRLYRPHGIDGIHDQIQKDLL